MDEVKNNAPEEGAQEEKTPEQIREDIRRQIEELKKAQATANEVMAAGKGRLRLEVPIRSGDTEITEILYDFTKLTGLEYTDAMDSDTNANQMFRITYRQALALFAKAAAKCTDRLDMNDIISKLGITGAQEGVQLAALFFMASARAARQRISKM